MSISEQELEAKRARAQHLRREISSLRTEGVGSRLDREREVSSRALDDEIEMLERQVLEAAKSSGGTVEDAMAAMERAAEVEKMLTPEKDSDEGSDGKLADEAQLVLGTIVAKIDDENSEGNK